MKTRSKTIIIAVAVLVALFLLIRMRESYEGDAGPAPEKEEDVEEDLETKKMIEEKGITQEDLDNLMSIIG